MSEYFSLRLKDDLAVRLGFAPGAYACPVARASIGNRVAYVVVGLDDEYSSLKIAKDLYRGDHNSLRALVGQKTHNIFGPINDIDEMKDTLSISCNDEYKTKPYEAIKNMIADIVGDDITGNKQPPTSLIIVNMMLDYIKENKKDHARLLYHWPMFFDHFRTNPHILDRAVKGESLWDALEDYYPKDFINMAKKIKNFTPAWNDIGVRIERYLSYLLSIMQCLPKGSPPPQTQEEASRLVTIDMFFVSAFSGFRHGNQIAARLFFADKNNRSHWKTFMDEKKISNIMRGDYTRYLRDNLIRAIIPDISDEGAIKVILAMHGNKVHLINAGSEKWHIDMLSAYKKNEDIKYSVEWPAPFETINVPEDVVPGGYSIVSLHTRDMLVDEGDAQRHCVGHHNKRCAAGDVRVIGIRKDEKRVSTAAIIKNDKSDLIYEQHYAFANQKPNDEAVKIATWFLEGINNESISFFRNWPYLVKTDNSEIDVDTLRDIYISIQPTLTKKYKEGGYVEFEKLCRTISEEL